MKQYTPKEWDALPESEKTRLEAQFDAEYDAWYKAFNNWRDSGALDDEGRRHKGSLSNLLHPNPGPPPTNPNPYSSKGGYPEDTSRHWGGVIH